jgi:hypothetical protein
MRIILIIILFSLPYCCYSQFKDDFSSVDSFKQNKWEGDTEHFIIDTKGMLRLSNPGQTTISYLSAPVQCSIPCYWECEVIMDFNPSKFNNCRIYLWADSQNLKNDLKGYYLLLGGSDDAIALFQQNDEQSDCLIRLSKAVSESFNRIVVRVALSETAWSLSYRKINEKQFNTVGSVPASSISFSDSGFLGLSCQYTATNSKKFYFNYLYVEKQSPETDNPDDNPDGNEPDPSSDNPEPSEDEEDLEEDKPEQEEPEENEPEMPTANDTIPLTNLPAITDSPTH